MAPYKQSFYGEMPRDLSPLSDYFQALMADDAQPLWRLPAVMDDLAQIEQIARTIRENSSGLVVCGTGGSSLGGQTLCALSETTFLIYFLDNMDPVSLDRFIQSHDMATLHALFISKSGTTVETLAQCAMLIQAMQQAGADVKTQCHIITQPGARPLREVAEHFAIPVLDHDPSIGGRYSVLSVVGLLPAAVAGIDIHSVRAGANEVMQQVLIDEHAAPLDGARWSVTLMKRHPICVWMPYADRLSLFGTWVQQCWAESLGKNGQGSTPVRAVGAVDQHSQLQLYLDGPRDKSFTFITLPYAGSGVAIATHQHPAFKAFGTRTSGDVMAALQYGTLETFKRHALPMRELALQRLDARTLGALLMHVMIETVAAAKLLGVDPFDQPAVEEGKLLAQAFLKSTGAAA